MEALTPERFRELWSRTYNQEGKPDWSHIFPYYHPKMFLRTAFKELKAWKNSKRCVRGSPNAANNFNMEIISVAMNPGEIFFQWKMEMKFNKYPPTPVYGCSKLTMERITGSFTSGIISTCGEIFSMASPISAGLTGSSYASISVSGAES